MPVPARYIGFYSYSLAAGEERSIFDHLYRSFQLIVLEGGNIRGIIPWQLEVARFLMPVLAGYTAIQALLAVSVNSGSCWVSGF